ncbi:MAG: ribbon-helix-helix protein, CopG family [Actinomycetota bacterium]|nr:ribbon-helix-helix protein, CopG family [Actinomycetota bacterium]
MSDNTLTSSGRAMRAVALRMPDELIAALSEVAAEEDRPLSYVVRRAAREFLARKNAAA